MKFCLIGQKLAHSYSAIIHKEFGYQYELCEMEREDLPAFVRGGSFDGFNVTIPYKTLIMPLLDEIDDAAKRVGAVNTVVVKDKKLYGYNTDVFGLEYLLQSADIQVKNKKVMILGSGGTSKTALAVLKTHGAASTVVVSRSGADNYDNISKHYDSEVIINTTPVGMYPSNLKSPIELAPFTRLEGVMDAIYNPLITRLLFDAKERGLKYSSGLKMLIAQAKEARDLFVGDRAPESEIERIYRKLYNDTINIVLIGMPSSGKSVVGKALAAAMAKRFVDTDEYIQALANKSIPNIFALEGEKHFRNLERVAIEALGKEKGQVIATGGGAITSREAYHALKQNGVLVYLIRDPRNAVSDGRPLLKDEGAYERLFKEREPYYKKFSDITIENNGEVDQTVAKIIASLPIQ
ncbi:MAG: shikimate kinase [Clostridia bacterium]